MNRFNSILIRILESLLAVCLFVIVSIVVMQVFLSFVFNTSITGANEVVTKLFVYLTAIGAGLAVGKGEHIAITFATDLLGPRYRRVAERSVLVLVAFLNLIIAGYSFHWIRITGHFLMPTTQLPRIFAQVAVPLGCGITVVFCVLRLFAAHETSRHNIPDEQDDPAFG